MLGRTTGSIPRLFGLIDDLEFLVIMARRAKNRRGEVPDLWQIISHGNDFSSIGRTFHIRVRRNTLVADRGGR